MAFDDEEDWERQARAGLQLQPSRQRPQRSACACRANRHPPAAAPTAAPAPAPLLQAAPVSAPGLGPILNTALRGLSAVSGRLGDLALQYAPADASPGAVRTAVNVGLVLLALSFVRSLLSVSRWLLASR